MTEEANWCGNCGALDGAERCANCDYCICPRCRQDGRCLCGAPLGYDPATEARPGEREVLEAIAAMEPDYPPPHLVARLTAVGYSDVAVRGVLERLYDTGLIDCGLSLQLPWLTDEGRRRLKVGVV